MKKLIYLFAAISLFILHSCKPSVEELLIERLKPNLDDPNSLDVFDLKLIDSLSEKVLINEIQQINLLIFQQNTKQIVLIDSILRVNQEPINEIFDKVDDYSEEIENSIDEINIFMRIQWKKYDYEKDGLSDLDLTYANEYVLRAYKEKQKWEQKISELLDKTASVRIEFFYKQMKLYEERNKLIRERLDISNNMYIQKYPIKPLRYEFSFRAKNKFGALEKDKGYFIYNINNNTLFLSDEIQQLVVKTFAPKEFYDANIICDLELEEKNVFTSESIELMESKDEFDRQQFEYFVESNLYSLKYGYASMVDNVERAVFDYFRYKKEMIKDNFDKDLMATIITKESYALNGKKINPNWGMVVFRYQEEMKLREN